MIGALFTSNLPEFDAGILGDAQIPVFQLNQAGTAKLRPAAVAGRSRRYSFAKMGREPSSASSMSWARRAGPQSFFLRWRRTTPPTCGRSTASR